VATPYCSSSSSLLHRDNTSAVTPCSVNLGITTCILMDVSHRSNSSSVNCSRGLTKGEEGGGGGATDTLGPAPILLCFPPDTKSTATASASGRRVGLPCQQSLITEASLAGQSCGISSRSPRCTHIRISSLLVALWKGILLDANSHRTQPKLYTSDFRVYTARGENSSGAIHRIVPAA